jgi:hypothetical protein
VIAPSSDGQGENEREERERRTLVNLLAAIALLVVAISAVWLMNYLDQRRKLELCLEAGRRDCLGRFDPAAR